YNFPFMAVITKSDKLTRSQQMQAKAKLSKELSEWGPRCILLFSAHNRNGRDDLLKEIGVVLEESKLASEAKPEEAPDDSANAANELPQDDVPATESDSPEDI